MDIEVDEVMLRKAAVIERSLNRVIEEYKSDPGLESYTHQDALILNIERACQAAIDLAMHLVLKKRLGIPVNSADAFRLLEKSKLISPHNARSMVGMTGFRNIAVHEYQKLSLDIVKNIAQSGWKALELYCSELGLRIKID